MPGIDPITGKTIYSSPLQPKPPGDVQIGTPQIPPTGTIQPGTLQAPVTGLATRMQQPSPLTSLLERDTQIGTAQPFQTGTAGPLQRGLPPGMTMEQLQESMGVTTPMDTILDTDRISPWTSPFMEVYETTKAGAMKNLEEMQKDMAERFAHRGGYFGGKHAIGQAELGEKTGTALDQLLSQVSLGASEREYQDWLRARQETMMPFNMISNLLGAQTTQPLVTTETSPLAGLLGGVGPGLAALAAGK